MAAPTLEKKTSPSTRRHRRQSRQHRRSVWFAALVLLVSASMLNATSCESTESSRSQLVTLINRSRRAFGLGPVHRNVELDVKADSWARHLRDVCGLSHSVLSDGAPPSWIKLGENVGSGGGIAQIHRGFMHSPGHRSNVLDPSFTTVGTAAVSGDCDGFRKVFVVTVYMQSQG
ncbi:hypothetical protein BH10ACT3_BH10ACT3_21880 [soil metagenome]